MVVLLLALVLIFLVLLFEFRSFSAPMAILSSAVLSTSGVFLALLITRTTFNVSSFMGLIMVIGIVAKNGILLLDANQKFRIIGFSAEEALVQAGRRRLRPIVMTAMAAVAGMLPLSLALGAGSQMLQPLAIAVIGGILISMVLSLIITPAMQFYLTRDREGTVHPDVAFERCVAVDVIQFNELRPAVGSHARNSLRRMSLCLYDALQGLCCGGCSCFFGAYSVPASHRQLQKARPIRSCAGYPWAAKANWDYLRVDPDTHRIYISRGTHMMIVDEVSGKVIGDIPDTKGIHGVALATDLGKGFTSNGGDGTVTVFDLKTLKADRDHQSHRRKSGFDHLRSLDEAGVHLQRQEQQCDRD